MRPASTHAGLTLAELLVCLVILSVLAATAWPSFTELLARQAVDQAADRLAASLALARSTAMARRIEVTLQPLDGQPGLDHGWQLLAGPGPDTTPLAVGSVYI